MAGIEPDNQNRPAAAGIRVPALLATLGGLTAIAPLATDMYVAAFPAMATQFGAPEAAVQLTMTTFVVGLAVGQFLIGPVSDAIGRRRLLLIGIAAFAVTSFLAAFATSTALLAFLRAVQGLAGAVGIVLGRAVVADWFHGQSAAKHFSTLTSISVLGPVIAPVAGGLILTVSTWQAIFVVLGVIGALLFVAAVVWVPESLPRERRSSHGIASAFTAMLSLLRRRRLVSNILVLSLGMLALFAYILESTFIFQDQYGISAPQYSAVFAVNAIGILIASLLVGRLATRFPLRTLLGGGIILSILASMALLMLAWTGLESLPATWALLFCCVFGLGLALPSATTLALAEGHDSAGGTSALIGGTQFIFAGLATPALSGLPTPGTLAIATVLCGAFTPMGLSTLLHHSRQGTHRGGPGRW